MKVLFSFSGRLNRGRYIGYSISISILELFASILPNYFNDSIILLILLLVSLLLAAAAISITIQRLHDIERPGWQLILLIVPLYNVYLILKLLFTPGTEGPNEYGLDPLDNNL